MCYDNATKGCEMLYFFDYSYDALTIFCFVLAYFLAVILAITFHEFAHAYTAYKCGDDTARLMGRMTLNPFAHINGIGLLCFLFVGFGWAKPVQVNPLKYKNYKRDNVLVSLSGVVTNLVLAFFASGIYYLICHLCGTDITAYSNYFLILLKLFFQYFFIINLSLAIFNILPIYPLDGFNFLATFLNYNNKFVQFMYKYGNLILIILIVTPFFDIFYQIVMSGLTTIFGLFWGLFF